MNIKIGTILETIFKYTGVKWLVKKIVIDWLGYESCGCEDRRDKLNSLTFKRND
mgnify:FL=1|jgi:hypothetical protein